MKQLIAEGNDMIAECEDDDTRDAVMIAAAQKVEHYEIASYGTIRTWANALGKNDVASIFEETLEEEKAADQKLTGIAESFVNQAAADKEAGEGEEEEEEPAPARGQTRASRTTSPRPGRQVAADRARTGARGRGR
jgi:hypothetical protein